MSHHGHQQRSLAKASTAIDQGFEVVGLRQRSATRSLGETAPPLSCAKRAQVTSSTKHPRGFGFTQQLQETTAEAQFRSAPNAVNGALALKNGLGSMQAPNQIVVFRRRQAFGFGFTLSIGLGTAIAGAWTTVPAIRTIRSTTSVEAIVAT